MALKKLRGTLRVRLDGFGGRMRGLASRFGSRSKVPQRAKISHRGSIGPFARQAVGVERATTGGALVTRVRGFLERGHLHCPDGVQAIQALAARLERFKSLFPDVGRRVELSDSVNEFAVGVGGDARPVVCRTTGVFPFAGAQRRFSLASLWRR